MIQRIQSVYLLLAGLAFIGTSLFRHVLAMDTQTWILPTVTGLNVLVGIGALVSIFMYSDRKKQLGIISLLQYVALFVLLAAFGALYLSGGLAEITANLEVMALLVLPVLGYVLIRLAGTKIKKDIALVRSMDRLR